MILWVLRSPRPLLRCLPTSIAPPDLPSVAFSKSIFENFRFFRKTYFSNFWIFFVCFENFRFFRKLKFSICFENFDLCLSGAEGAEGGSQGAGAEAEGGGYKDWKTAPLFGKND